MTPINEMPLKKEHLDSYVSSYAFYTFCFVIAMYVVPENHISKKIKPVICILVKLMLAKGKPGILVVAPFNKCIKFFLKMSLFQIKIPCFPKLFFFLLI